MPLAHPNGLPGWIWLSCIVAFCVAFWTGVGFGIGALVSTF